MLTEEQIRHIAKLGRIALTDEEVERYTTQLSDVLDYMEILNELKTDDVEGTNQVTGLENVLDADIVHGSQSTPEELLKCTELPVDTQQIRVKKTI
jgi:aspartyl/glutamyl-tRNA(Asn/Gln) amidotransferase C subunit